MKKKQSVIRAAASSPYVVWSVLFIVAPLLFVLWFAFTDGNGSFSFDNIRGLSAYGRTFVMSIGFSLIATTVCFLIGYPLAYAMSRASKRARNILTILLMLPMWTSLLVRTYALMALLDNGGIVSNALTKIRIRDLTNVFITGILFFICKTFLILSVFFLQQFFNCISCSCVALVG